MPTITRPAILLLLAAGCGESPAPGGADLAARDGTGGGGDLAGADLAATDATAAGDLAVADLVAAPDLAPAPDMAAAVKTTVGCGINVTCVDPASVCCSGDHGRTGTCVAPAMMCMAGIPYDCDGPDDCPMGDVCCLTGKGAACSAPAACAMLGGDVLCEMKADCPNNGNCCNYNINQNGFHRCQAGPCPISLRRYKRDIRYLDGADRARLRDELVRYPLATWRYRHEGEAAPVRLGFIIDDVAPSAAVAPDGQTVDLYGYATMAVATLQEQEREIAELRAELKQLKREVAASRPAPSSRRKASRASAP